MTVIWELVSRVIWTRIATTVSVSRSSLTLAPKLQSSAKTSCSHPESTSTTIASSRRTMLPARKVRFSTHPTIQLVAPFAPNWMVGCAENLTSQVGDVVFKVHAHVVENASFSLLLGCPFQQAALCRFEDLLTGEVEVSVCDPTNMFRRVFLVSRPCTGRAPAAKTLSILDCSPSFHFRASRRATHISASSDDSNNAFIRVDPGGSNFIDLDTTLLLTLFLSNSHVE